jgi:large subunit ribosomal protein L13
MIVVDGKGAVLGRLASFVAKETLKGKEISVINCDQVIITGNKRMIEKEFKEKRSRIGSSQKGPKHHANSEKIVKRTIRGMLPNHREGRGKEALKKIKCYVGIPKELGEIKPITLKTGRKMKTSEVREFTRR